MSITCCGKDMKYNSSLHLLICTNAECMNIKDYSPYSRVNHFRDFLAQYETKQPRERNLSRTVTKDDIKKILKNINAKPLLTNKYVSMTPLPFWFIRNNDKSP